MTARRIRILLVTTSMAGGAGLYAYQLARDLDRTRFDLRLAFGPGYPLDRAVAGENLPHHILGWSRNLNPIRTVAGTVDLVQLLRREPVDILHAQCSLAGAIGRPLGRLFRVPHVVFTCHAFASRDYQPAWRQAHVPRHRTRHGRVHQTDISPAAMLFATFSSPNALPMRSASP